MPHETMRIQLNECCGIRSYRPIGTPRHICVACGRKIRSNEPYELYLADTTPRPIGFIA